MKRHLAARGRILHFSGHFMKSFATPSLVFLVVTGNMTLLVGAILFYCFEKGINPQVSSLFDALWWAFTTVTTVGYGDIVPITTDGRVVGIILMLSGAVFFFGFTAILISVFSALTTEEFLETEKLTKKEYEDVVMRLNMLGSKIEELNRKIDLVQANTERGKR